MLLHEQGGIMEECLVWGWQRCRGMAKQQRNQEQKISCLYSLHCSKENEGQKLRECSPNNNNLQLESTRGISNESTEFSGASQDHAHRTERDQKCVCLASHIQSTCNLPDNGIVSLEYPRASSMLNVPYSGKDKGIFGLSRHVRFKCVGPLETILQRKIRAVHYTCYPSKVLRSC